MSKVKPIPDGYHTVTPFLIVKQADKAIHFYKQAFGAEELERHNAPDGKIMHALIKIGNSYVMLADEFPEYGCGASSPATLSGSSAVFHLYVEDVDSAFDQAARAGAEITMPLMDAFWGDRYGQVKDPFGHFWSLATRKVNMAPEDLVQKGNECMTEKFSEKEHCMCK